MASQPLDVKSPVKDEAKSTEGVKTFGSLRTSGIIKIRPVRSGITKKNLVLGKTRLYPKKDEDDNIVINHTKEELRSYERLKVLARDIHNREVINDEFIKKFVFTIPPEGTDLDLSKERDRFCFQIMLLWPDIVSESVTKKTNKTRFYVSDEAKEAESATSKQRLIHEATTKLYGMSAAQMIDMCSLYSTPTKGLTATRAEQKLVERINKNPQDFTDKIKNASKTQDEILLSLFVEYRILKQDQGAYYHESELIGANKDQAIASINRPELAGRKAILETQLNQVRQTVG